MRSSFVLSVTKIQVTAPLSVFLKYSQLDFSRTKRVELMNLKALASFGDKNSIIKYLGMGHRGIGVSGIIA